MPYGSKFDGAFLFAAELHREQVRKSTNAPYITHLMGVAAIVGEHGGDEEEAIAALLHDAVEDQGGAPVLQAIRERFGARVADIVNSCTDTDQDPKPPWRERKEAYLAHLEHASPSARLVSVSDKLYNARTIVEDLRRHGARVWERFKGGKDGSLWYYRALANTFLRLGPADLADQLHRVVTQMETLARANEPAVPTVQ